MSTNARNARSKAAHEGSTPLTTGDLAERSAVNVQTLRYYERRGLLPEPPRSESGYRQYPRSAVSRIRFIKRAQGLGFTLGQIEDLLGLRVDPAESCDAVRERAIAHREEIEGKIGDLARMRDALEELIAACEAEREPVECPILETLEGRTSVGERLEERAVDGGEA